MKTSRYLTLLSLASLALGAWIFSGCQVEDIASRTIGLTQTHAQNLGNAQTQFTPEQEHYLGRAVAAQIFSRYPALEDHAANEYLNKLGQAIAQSSNQPYTYGGYHFMLLDSNEVNAFAAPDGLIFVTKGMVALISDEGELSAVLAHEIAHVQNKDAIKAIENSRMNAALTALGTDVAGQAVGGLPGSELLGLFSDSINDIVVTLMDNGYSRGQEYAADAGARNILNLAGYDAKNLEAVLRSMEKRVHEGSAGFGSTHPSAGKRLEALKASGAAPEGDTETQAARFKAALGKYSAAAR